MKKILNAFFCIFISAVVFTGCNPPAASNGGSGSGGSTPIDFPAVDEWTNLTQVSQITGLSFRETTKTKADNDPDYAPLGDFYKAFKCGDSASEFKDGYYVDMSDRVTTDAEWELKKNQLKSEYGSNSVDFIDEKKVAIVYRSHPYSEEEILNGFSSQQWQINQNKTRIKTINGMWEKFQADVREDANYLIKDDELIWMEKQICQHWKTERAPNFVNLIFNTDHTGKYWKNEPEWNVPNSYEPPEQYVTKFNWKINRVNGHVELYIGNNKIQDSKYSLGTLEGHLDYITFEYFDSCENLEYYRVD